MGGGDLNQKKSWHPHTIKNQERVWKAEQAKSQEEKRVKELRREIDEERNREDLRRIGESSGVLAKSDGDKNLEWMYKRSTDLVNREEYLLGRAVDKSFETLQAEEQNKDSVLGVKQAINHVEHECIPFSIREYKNLESMEQVDLQRKQMEDPLMIIKQKEMESRRKLLENPVKLKELHRILKSDHQLDTNKKHKKAKAKAKKAKGKKSKKKHKKHTKASSSSSSSDSDGSEEDLDVQLAKKYKKVKGSLLNEVDDLKDLSLSKLLDAKYETISKELDKAAKSNSKKKTHRSSDSAEKSIDSNYKKDYAYDSRYRREENRNYRDRSPRRYSPNVRRNREYNRRSRSVEEPKRYHNARDSSSRRSKSRSPNSPHRRDAQRRSPNSPHRRDAQRRSPNSPHRRDAQRPPPNSSKLSEQEKEARRREMMENAAWRENDRTKAVKRHRDSYEREENQNKAREFDKDFISKEVRKAIAKQDSVGSRIRSNLNNIQRTKSSMNSNFARK